MLTPMRHPRRIPDAPLALAAALLLATGACSPSDEELAANEAAALEVVEQFGQRLRLVSVGTIPPADLGRRLTEAYGPYVTTLLLGGWISDPASAPGREGSSPWPARIEVRELRSVGGTGFDFDADVIYVTGVDENEPPAFREPVTLRVVRGPDDVWRISEWTQRG